MNREIEALEEWDPDMMAGSAPELWRRRLLARDQGGDLRRAQRATRQAAALAGNSDEAYRAALLLDLLASDAGDHKTELKLARKTTALQPHSQASLDALWHAEQGNGTKPPACQAVVAVRPLRQSRGTGTRRATTSGWGQRPGGPSGIDRMGVEPDERAPEHYLRAHPTRFSLSR